MIMLAYLI